MLRLFSNSVERGTVLSGRLLFLSLFPVFDLQNNAGLVYNCAREMNKEEDLLDYLYFIHTVIRLHEDYIK